MVVLVSLPKPMLPARTDTRQAHLAYTPAATSTMLRCSLRPRLMPLSGCNMRADEGRIEGEKRLKAGLQFDEVQRRMTVP